VGKEMARKPRIHYEGALYHVICRGNNREYVFKDDGWKSKYLSLIEKYKKRYGFKVYAYVIMDNHVHMLIEVDHVPLSKIMQGIQQVFTQTYNRVHQRTGHIFEQRYKAILCDKDQYLLMLIRYIHQNPVRINHEDGLEYKWSSYNGYLDETKNVLIDVQFPMSLFDNRMDRFINFMSEEEKEVKEISIREFSEEIDEYERMKNQDREEFSMELEEIVDRVCRYIGIEKDILKVKGRTKNVVKARKLIVFIASRNSRIKHKEIAEVFNQGANNVSMMLSKSELINEYENEIEELLKN